MGERFEDREIREAGCVLGNGEVDAGGSHFVKAAAVGQRGEAQGGKALGTTEVSEVDLMGTATKACAAGEGEDRGHLPLPLVGGNLNCGIRVSGSVAVVHADSLTPSFGRRDPFKQPSPVQEIDAANLDDAGLVGEGNGLGDSVDSKDGIRGEVAEFVGGVGDGGIGVQTTLGDIAVRLLIAVNVPAVASVGIDN